MHRIVHVKDVTPQLWKNGGGRTRELLTWPPEGDWQLRISLADIEADGPFSAFPGVTRWFTVIEGRGVELRFGDGTETLGLGSAPLRFDGADAPGCTLIDGPTRDLNLMLRGGEGVLEPASPGEPWTGTFAQSGLFTTVPGTLQVDCISLPMSAGTLAWQSGPVAAAPSFTPDEPATGPAAWWMGFSPNVGAGPA